MPGVFPVLLHGHGDDGGRDAPRTRSTVPLIHTRQEHNLSRLMAATGGQAPWQTIRSDRPKRGPRRRNSPQRHAQPSPRMHALRPPGALAWRWRRTVVLRVVLEARRRSIGTPDSHKTEAPTVTRETKATDHTLNAFELGAADGQGAGGWRQQRGRHHGRRSAQSLHKRPAATGLTV
jgi:hypothetical protein